MDSALWIPFSGLLNGPATIEVTSLGNGTASLLVSTPVGNETVTYSVTTNVITATYWGEAWTADGWMAMGRFQCESTRRDVGQTGAKDPWYRFNSFGTVLIGDRGTA